MNSIEIKDLSLNFGDVKVLKDLNLAVKKGEFLELNSVVLIGPDGVKRAIGINKVIERVGWFTNKIALK